MPSSRPIAILAKLHEIEAEMKRIGFWSDSVPNLQVESASEEPLTFLNAPSFELWLQCVFIPNARAAAEKNDLPTQSQVGLMALRQYDYHSYVEEAQHLLDLLHEFDNIIESW